MLSIQLISRLLKKGGPTKRDRIIITPVYNAVRHGMDYVDPGASFYETHYRSRVIESLQRRAKTFGLDPIRKWFNRREMGVFDFKHHRPRRKTKAMRATRRALNS